jgi:hypothetical protein
MNLVGKIFVVLIFLASTVFMTMALMVFATHRNWLDEVMAMSASGGTAGWKERLDTAQKEQAKLKADNDKLQTVLDTENKAHLAALTKAETERQRLVERNQTLEADKEKEEKRLDLASADLKTSQDVLTGLRADNEKLREDIRTANKNTDEQFKKAVAFEDKLHIALGQKDDLDIRNKQLAEQVAHARQLLATVNMTLETPISGQPPTVRGQVLEVDQDNRAEISLGTDDGLREGHMLEAFRGDKYLGRMQVLEVHPHRAVVKILKEYQQDAIRKGDEVATRLKA